MKITQNNIDMSVDNWMQNNPLKAMVLTIILTSLSSFAIVGAEWSHQDKIELETKIQEKATIEYVDKEIQTINEKIDEAQEENSKMLKEIRTDIKYILKEMPK